jgi:hypothetical protein
MTKQIQFDYTPPIQCTDAQIEEYIKYQFGYGDISDDNPLRSYDFVSGYVNNLNIDGDEVQT